MNFLSLLRILLLICSFSGFFWAARRTLRLQQAFIPLFVFSALGCLVYFCGLLGFLYAGAQVLFGCGILLLAICIGRIFRKKERLNLKPSLFEWLFFIGSFFFFALLARSTLVHYDNFSHWALVLKQIISTNAFPTAASDLIEYKNYPLGTASFLYYFCLFAGHTQSAMLIGQGLLIFACFYAMFGIISEKGRFLLYAFLGLGCSALSWFNLTVRINNLLVDFLLPLYTLALFALIHRYRDDLKTACIALIPIAGFLTVIKNTGLIFALIGLIELFFVFLAKRDKPSWKGALWALCAGAGALLPYLFWQAHMALRFQGVENKFQTTAGDLATLQTAKTPEQLHAITAAFFRAMLDPGSRPAIGIVFFNIAAAAATVLAAVLLKKHWKLWKALIALDGMLVLYYLGILGLYLFSMPLSEAMVLAGFERYASSIVILFVGGLVLTATVDIERSFYYRVGEVPAYCAFKNVRNKNRYQEAIIACVALSATMLLSEYNGLLSIRRGYPDTLPAKVFQVTGDRWYLRGEEDPARYLFYASDKDQQVTNYYLQNIGRYLLYASRVDGIVLFYEDNMDHLLSQYDYLVVVENDPKEMRLLQKHYGINGRPGIYKITASYEKVTLAEEPDTK